MSVNMNDLMSRIKNLKQFIVEVEVPEQMLIDGKFPFDTTIYDGKAHFKVYAASQEEADRQVQKFLNKEY